MIVFIFSFVSLERELNQKGSLIAKRNMTGRREIEE